VPRPKSSIILNSLAAPHNRNKLGKHSGIIIAAVASLLYVERVKVGGHVDCVGPARNFSLQDEPLVTLEVETFDGALWTCRTNRFRYYQIEVIDTIISMHAHTILLLSEINSKFSTVLTWSQKR